MEATHDWWCCMPKRARVEQLGICVEWLSDLLDIYGIGSEYLVLTKYRKGLKQLFDIINPRIGDMFKYSAMLLVIYMCNYLQDETKTSLVSLRAWQDILLTFRKYTMEELKICLLNVTSVVFRFDVSLPLYL